MTIYRSEWIGDEATAGGRGNSDRPVGAIAALRSALVDLVERIREGIPEREYVPGCEGWLIRAKRYLIFSPSGVGKSLAVLIIAVEVVRRGGTVVIIDVENGADEYARRLETILDGDEELAAACSERLRYYEYPALALDWSAEEWLAALADCDVVVFDSSRNVLSAVGLAEDANDDYARFMNRLVMPLSKAGRTTLILDNAGHEGDWPRGASTKRDLNEVLFSLSIPDGDLDLETERRLVWRRTRGRFASAIPAVLEQRIGGGTYGLPESMTDEGDAAPHEPFRPTGYMERVSRYVEFHDGCSQTRIVKGVGGKEKHVVTAIQLLDEEGFIRHEDGARGSHLHHSVTPYREANDDRAAPPPDRRPDRRPDHSGEQPTTAAPRTPPLPTGGGGGRRSVGPPPPTPPPPPIADVGEDGNAGEPRSYEAGAARLSTNAYDDSGPLDAIREQTHHVRCSCVAPADLTDDGRCSRCFGWPENTDNNPGQRPEGGRGHGRT